MPFTLIKGSFHVVGREPDGDTLAFSANKKSHWRKLDGPRPRFNMKGKGTITSLRFEAIDTLETHYVPERGMRVHQPFPQADDATDFMLKKAGFKNVVWGMKEGKRTRVTSASGPEPGYVLSRTTERFGRPVSFVFAGTTPKADGSSQFLDVKWLKQSLNYQLVKSGYAYPTYYEAMCQFVDLRDALTDAAVSAYNQSDGVWADDTSRRVRVTGEKNLIDRDVVLPKLFRRLTTYLRTQGNGNITGFRAWLKKRDDRLLVLTSGLMADLSAVIKQSGQVIELTEEPENLVFKP